MNINILNPTSMKTHTQKSPAKHETFTAVFVITALLVFFAVVVYNMLSHEVGL